MIMSLFALMALHWLLAKYRLLSLTFILSVLTSFTELHVPNYLLKNRLLFPYHNIIYIFCSCKYSHHSLFTSWVEKILFITQNSVQCQLCYESPLNRLSSIITMALSRNIFFNYSYLCTWFSLHYTLSFLRDRLKVYLFE